MATAPNPAAVAFSIVSKLRGPFEPLPFGFNPLNDSAVRASLESQGLAIPTGDVAGSNVPQVQVTGNPAQSVSQSVGLPGLGAKIEGAARQELQASQAAIGARLAAALRGSDIDAAQRGFLRSGSQQGRRDDLRIAAIQASAQAQGSIALDRLGIEQRAKEAQDRFDLTVAQLNAQKSQATNALLVALAKAAVTLGPDALSAFGIGGGNDLGAGDQLSPLDDFGLGATLPESVFDVGGTA